MKVAMMGTGGVGGVFGALLAQAGNDVYFIARDRQLAAIRERGLRILGGSPNDVHIYPANVTDDPSIVSVVDVVFISVKLWDTEEAARLIRPMIGPETMIISLQNGIEKEEILRRQYGAEHVVGGIAYIGAALEEPGVIRQRGKRQHLVFGEYNQRRSARLLKLTEQCKAAHIKASVSDEIEVALWEKFVVLTSMSALTSAARHSIGPVRSDPHSRALLVAALHEAAAVGRAAGVNLDAEVANRQLGYLDSLDADVTSSMHHDVEQGNRLELPWLSGTLVELGAKHAVETPVHRFLVGILSPSVNGAQAIKSPINSHR